MNQPLFTAPNIALTALDAEADEKSYAAWTQDSRFIPFVMESKPPHPLSEAQAKKMLEETLKEADEKRTSFWFGIRTLDESELLGIVTLYWVDWGNRAVQMDLMMKDLDGFGKISAKETLALMQNYVFNEINMHSLHISTPEYNKGLAKTLTGLGFVEEVRRREARYRFGKRWDVLHYGILASEWKK